MPHADGTLTDPDLESANVQQRLVNGIVPTYASHDSDDRRTPKILKEPLAWQAARSKSSVLDYSNLVIDKAKRRRGADRDKASSCCPTCDSSHSGCGTSAHGGCRRDGPASRRSRPSVRPSASLDRDSADGDSACVHASGDAPATCRDGVSTWPLPARYRGKPAAPSAVVRSAAPELGSPTRLRRRR